MNWFPPDDFYPGYSLYRDIGYGAEGEKNSVQKALIDLNINVNDDNVRKYLELTRTLMVFITEECKEEVKEYSKYLRDELYVGLTLPIELVLAKILAALIGRAIIHVGKNFYKKIKKHLEKETSEKDEEKPIQEKRIIRRLIEKIEVNENNLQIFRIIEEFEKNGSSKKTKD